jgi:hypothetical protein
MAIHQRESLAPRRPFASDSTVGRWGWCLPTVLLAALIGACSVTRYNHEPIPFDERFVRIVPNERLADEGRADSWRRTTAVCYRVRQAMIREADEIAANNRLVGSLFATAVGAMSATLAIYSTADRSPDPTTVAVLGLASTAATVPTFFYFGDDERERALRARIGAVEARLEAANESYDRLLEADRDYSQIHLSPLVKPSRDTALAAAEARINEAKDRLDEAIRALADTCV